MNELFPAGRKKGISLIIGSSLNAGFSSGCPRYNYGKEIHIEHLAPKRF
jgi:D-threo-aldose 1-dehydrogenase